MNRGVVNKCVQVNILETMYGQFKIEDVSSYTLLITSSPNDMLGDICAVNMTFACYYSANLFVMEFFYPYGIKSRTLRLYPGRFGPGSFRSGHFGLNHFGQFFVVSNLIGGSFLPYF